MSFGGGTKVAEMYGELTIRDDKYHAGLDAAQKEAVIFVGKLTGTFGQMRGALSTVVSALAVRQVAGFFQQAIGAAADYQDTLNRTKAVLKGSADIVISESERMADSLGVVKSEYLSAATSFAASFKGAGFGLQEAARIGNQLTKLGMDLASFANTTNEDAFGALQAALRGEFDPIERYNVFINAAKIETEAFSLGLIKNKSELDDHAKRMAALSLIMKQTKDAQSDLTNTINDTHNATRRLSGVWTNFVTDTGQSLMPAVSAVLPEITRLGGEITDMAKGNQDEVAQLAKVIGEDLVSAIAQAREFTHALGDDLDVVAQGLKIIPEWQLKIAGLALDPRTALGLGGISRGAEAATGLFGGPEEVPEVLRRHRAEDEARLEARKKAAARPGAAPGAGAAGGAGTEAGAGAPAPGGGMSPAQRKAAIAAQTLPWDQLTPEEQYGVIQKQKEARKRAVELGQVPAAELTTEEQFDALKRQREERRHALELGKVPEAQMTAEERQDVLKKRDEERQKAIEAGSIGFGQMTPEEQVEALKKQRGVIEGLMPKEPARQSQLFTEGGSMEQQFQQRILEQTDKQDEANKLLKKIDEGIAKLNEATLKKATDKGFAMIAPAAAARR